jgi:hypothetical protein
MKISSILILPQVNESQYSLPTASQKQSQHSSVERNNKPKNDKKPTNRVLPGCFLLIGGNDCKLHVYSVEFTKKTE